MIRDGRTKHPLYLTWKDIKSRCSNPNRQCSKYYVGRGITMADEWSNSFQAFVSYVGERPSPDHSIDRIDNDRGYEPGNVRWATQRQQSRNSRRLHLFNINGELICLADVAQRTGLHPVTILSRLNKLGWDLKKSLETPPRGAPPLRGEQVSTSKLTEAHVLEILKSQITRRELAAKFGVSVCLIGQIKRGKAWSYLFQPTITKPEAAHNGVPSQQSPEPVEAAK